MTGRATEGGAKCQRGSRGGPEKESGWSPERGLCSKISLCVQCPSLGLAASSAFLLSPPSSSDLTSTTNSLLSLVAAVLSTWFWCPWITPVLVLLLVFNGMSCLSNNLLFSTEAHFQKHSAPISGTNFWKDLLFLERKPYLKSCVEPS